MDVEVCCMTEGLPLLLGSVPSRRLHPACHPHSLPGKFQLECGAGQKPHCPAHPLLDGPVVIDGQALYTLAVQDEATHHLVVHDVQQYETR